MFTLLVAAIATIAAPLIGESESASL
ncbi:MAG: hypothetical protein QOJ51_1465, partial [Acidobacteriaceae bacterium]|nr:hypothetical protein [Acidobacteriaceae bacterium]